ncbi:MAG: bifunctional UDP-3-O-[3-hydroxymyristoyl] N-acetylglucosamine deacetylase/3-hydroxyacyl-ACP dehydratase [Candidatus Sabulitectum sp.]|nr:bifunctional UDP-3-O-[3-hydroxymyristoyl] N-acetylglucosamine deacetylase/3-hydroxyacyl-ACP dehydratase [Candidatus Sabulitectum sp.]
MNRFQTTIKEQVSYTGCGLHLGKESTITFKPAPADTGYVFVRTDVEQRPTIKVLPENVRMVEEQARRTTLGENYYEVHTVEHVLSALYGLEIDNAIIEISSDEPPEPADGSVRSYVEVLMEAGVETLHGHPSKLFVITEPVSLEYYGASLTVVPYDGLKISFTLDYDHPHIGTQYISLEITRDSFINEIAPARTFCLYQDVKILQEKGLIKGGTLENAVVIGDDGVMNDSPLRFPDELVRHKVLDLIGDMALLGIRLQGHVIAAKSGHASNVQFVKKIMKVYAGKIKTSRADLAERQWDISDVMDLLPHRYPFLLVDRVLEIEPEKSIVAIKNVTINEPFFQGHFPGSPIMPGVLVIEAMAQAGGLMLFDSVEDPGRWLVLFGGIDRVRFRKPILPGDQIRFELELISKRGRMWKMRGVAKVDNRVAVEAELTAMLVEKK